MDPHQSKGPQPAKSISKVKVKRSSAWITRVINCKQSKKNEVRLQQMGQTFVFRGLKRYWGVMQRPNKKVGKKWNHLFDVDTDRGLVILGLYVPGELRLTPAYGGL